MSTLKQTVETEIKTAIDIQSAVKLCGKGNFTGVLYDDLARWSETRLAKYDGVMILFTKHGTNGGSVGHFCCAWKASGVWYFYDPLAVGYDKLLHIMHSERHLSRIWSGMTVKENRVRFQKFADNV